MAALVAECGRVWHDSVPLPKIPAFKNLSKTVQFVMVLNEERYFYIRMNL